MQDTSLVKRVANSPVAREALYRTSVGLLRGRVDTSEAKRIRQALDNLAFPYVFDHSSYCAWPILILGGYSYEGMTSIVSAAKQYRNHNT